MHRDISDEELEFWLEGEKYTISYDSYDEEALQRAFEFNEGAPQYKNGCVCKKCGEPFPYAEPNQEDGSFKCWGCRH